MESTQRVKRESSVFHECIKLVYAVCLLTVYLSILLTRKSSVEIIFSGLFFDIQEGTQYQVLNGFIDEGYFRLEYLLSHQIMFPPPGFCFKRFVRLSPFFS